MDVSYPEHEKLRAVRDKSQAIGEFLDWLQNSEGITFARLNEEGLHPDYCSIQRLLAKYFEIDLEKLEQEKQGMIEELRKANERG